MSSLARERQPMTGSGRRAPSARQPLEYLGFRLWDGDQVPRLARERSALRLSARDGGVGLLAELLAVCEPQDYSL